MKILLVDAHDDIQQKWVNPLRSKGCGAVLARSAEDASRMLILHGEGVEALVVHESFVRFAEAQSKPFVVLTERWTDREVMAHQNSSKPASGYLPRSGAVDSVLGLLAGGQARTKAVPELKATGTGGATRTGIRLQDASRLLSSPSLSNSGSSSVSLSAPKIKLRTKAGSAEGTNSGSPEPSLRLVPSVPEPEAPSVDAVPALEVPPPAVEAAPELLEAPEALELVIPAEEMPMDLSVDSPAEGLTDLPDEIAGKMAGESSLDLPVDVSTDEPIAEWEPLPELRSVPSFSGVEMSPDLETMKAYIAMREQDVAVLTGQARSSKERISQLEAMLKAEKARNTELEEMLAKTDQTLKNYDLEKRVEMEVIQKHADDLDQQLRDKTDKARVIETRLRLMSEEVNKVKERVRVDIRRIRVREKELEGQLEILKKDSGALLQARDEKILELKRRNDLLEFNMELVQEQYEKERRNTEELKGKLKEAAQVMKQANGFLEQ